MPFQWRDHLDAVNEILDRWNHYASTHEGWFHDGKETSWLEGAIFGLTGKHVVVDSMVDICVALGVPCMKLPDGQVAWGDALKRQGVPAEEPVDE